MLVPEPNSRKKQQHDGQTGEIRMTHIVRKQYSTNVNVLGFGNSGDM